MTGTSMPIPECHVQQRNCVEVLMRKIIPAMQALRAAALVGCVAATILTGAAASTAHAQQAYASPEAAFNALVAGVKTNDVSAILTALGPNGADIVSSGDQVLDKAERQAFLAAYDEKHSIENETENTAILIVGQVDFPFPIPVIRKDNAWRFDTAAGREQILHRRIGRNELSAIQACLAYADAQDDYAETSLAETGVATYAQRILSSPGKKDGLYWPSKEDERASPLGELIGRAASAGYRAGPGPTPFLGYYYKVLTRQGPAASGGAADYVVRGKMIGGFALVAYPAEYGNSGVMTFIVNHEGVVYEKDLGPRTAQVAPAIVAFNPDNTWRKAAMDVSP
jgi:Protein of unknown function (DUF2950)